MEQQRRGRIGGKLRALGALLVGVEHEPVGTVALQKNHANRWIGRFVNCREPHRLGVVRLTHARLGKPIVEQLEWVGRHLSRALGLASRLEQPIWSAMNDCGMGATWHSTFTSGWG